MGASEVSRRDEMSSSWETPIHYDRYQSPYCWRASPLGNIWSVQEPTKGGGEWALTSGDKRFTFASPHSLPGREDKENPVSGWICLLPVESPRKRP